MPQERIKLLCANCEVRLLLEQGIGLAPTLPPHCQNCGLYHLDALGEEAGEESVATFIKGNNRGHAHITVDGFYHDTTYERYRKQSEAVAKRGS